MGPDGWTKRYCWGYAYVIWDDTYKGDGVSIESGGPVTIPGYSGNFYRDDYVTTGVDGTCADDRRVHYKIRREWQETISVDGGSGGNGGTGISFDSERTDGSPGLISEPSGGNSGGAGGAGSLWGINGLNGATGIGPGEVGEVGESAGKAIIGNAFLTPDSETGNCDGLIS